MNIFNTLRGFAASLTPSERTGAGYYLLALLAVLVLLSSCTKEAYNPEPFPVNQESMVIVDDTVFTPAVNEYSVLENIEPGTSYTFGEFCPGHPVQEYNITFYEDGECEVCFPNGVTFTQCIVATFGVQDEVLHVFYNGGNVHEFTEDEGGNLTAVDAATGCTLVIVTE